MVRHTDSWRQYAERSRAGGFVHSLSGVFSADLETSRPLRHRHAISFGAQAHRLCHAGIDWEDAAELYRGESPDRTTHLGNECGDFWPVGSSVFLFHRVRERVPQPGALPRTGAGDGASDPGRSGTTGGWGLVGGGLRGRPAAPFRAERFVPENVGQPAEVESAGGHDCAAVLGMDLGRDRTGACDPDHRGAQDHL